jgi:hypothetical protein
MELPVVLRSSRRKMLLMLLGSLAFVGAGFWMLSEHPVSGYTSIIFFGVCALAFCVNLLPNSSYLRLTPDGFTICSTFRSRSIKWRDVGPFGVTRIGTKKMVGWDPSHPVSKLGKVNRVMCGYASAMPDTYGLKPEELAEILNRLRDERSAQII